MLLALPTSMVALFVPVASAEPPEPSAEPSNKLPPLPVDEPSELVVVFPHAPASSIDVNTRDILLDDIKGSSDCSGCSSCSPLRSAPSQGQQ